MNRCAPKCSACASTNRGQARQASISSNRSPAENTPEHPILPSYYSRPWSFAASVRKRCAFHSLLPNGCVKTCVLNSRCPWWTFIPHSLLHCQSDDFKSWFPNPRRYDFGLLPDRVKMPPLRSLTAASALICLCALFFIIWTYSTSDSTPPPPTSPSQPAIPAYGFKPFVAAWTSWFHPGVWTGAKLPAHNAGKIAKDWNILYHLGGNGPWVQKIDGIITNDISPPEGCEIQQVHMVSWPLSLELRPILTVPL
jgi:hypothetical protein